MPFKTNLQLLLQSAYLLGILINFVVGCCTLQKVKKVKNHKIKRESSEEGAKQNTTYSKISVWMLYVSFLTMVISLLLCLDSLYPLVEPKHPVRDHLLDGSHFLLLLMPMMNTLC